MKAKFAPVAVIIIAMLAILIAFRSQTANANRYRLEPPTEAPSPTPGAPVYRYGPTSVPLAQPLVTEEQALEQLLRIAPGVWEQPWSIDTLKTQPGRITLEAFPSLSAESGGVFAPEIDVDAGMVWRISINGAVHLGMLGIGVDLHNDRYDGATYVISQRTGNLLSISAGKPLPPATPAPALSAST